MRVAIRKIGGVEDVRVSLNQGVAVIRLRPDNRVTIERIRAAVRDNGFTPKRAEVRIAGTVAGIDRAFALVTPRGDTAFVLLAAPDLPGGDAALAPWVGNTVVLEGTVPATSTGTDHPVLEVRARVGATER